MENFWQQLKTPILAMAPMVGITDSSFRRLVKSWGADVVYSEMISADAIIRNADKALKMMDFEKSECPYVVQLMGNKPEVLAEAAKRAEKLGASGIDINFGCPANKIAKNYCGVMLMRDLDLSHDLIKATIEAVNIPVSIKVRTSINCQGNHWDENGQRQKITIVDFVKKMSDLDIKAIMIHGRSFEAPFDGDIDYDSIKEVKKIFTNGPVLANGGVTSVESSKEVLEKTQADGLGLARSVLGKPWVFKQIKDFLNKGSYEDVSWKDTKEAMVEHARLFYSFYGPEMFKPMRRHLSHYAKGFKNASHLRQKLVQTNSPEEVSQILKEY